jgi:hypothetical protein
MKIIAVDPGTNGLGVAWEHEGELAVFGLKAKGDLIDMITQYQALYLPKVDVFIGEIPQVYPKGKADPNDLIHVATAVGGCAGATSAAHFVFVPPRKWKGTLPKPIHHMRLMQELPKQWAEFLDEEKPKYTKAVWADVMDAVGLLWWYRKDLSTFG